MKRLLVKKGNLAVSSDPDAILETRSLGSTLGVCVKDQASELAGLAVVVLPRVPEDEGEATNGKALDAVGGLQNFFRALLSAGAKKEDLQVWLVGAATYSKGPKDLSLGVQTYAVVRKILAQNKIKVAGEHVGGPLNRSVELPVGKGGPRVFLPGKEEVAL
jgi:chemotaxis protein CheD